VLANLGLFWSVVCPTSAHAIGAMLTTIILVPVLVVVLYQLSRGHQVVLFLSASCDWLFDMSIAGRLDEILRARYRDGVWDLSVVMHILVSVALFVAAWMLFRRSAVDGEHRGGRGLLARCWHRLTAMGHGRPPRNLAALAWKDRHFVLGGYWWWVLRVLAGGAWVGFFHVMENGHVSAREWFVLLMFWGLFDLSLGCGIPLITAFAQEHQAQTHDDLLTLPHQPGAMFYAKLSSLWPGVLLSVGLFTVATVSDEHGRSLWEYGVGFAFVTAALAFWNIGIWSALMWRRGAVFIAGGVLAALGVLTVLLIESRILGIRGGEFNTSITLCVVFGLVLILTHILALRRFRAGSGA
jgi:hypothetical protein